MPYPGGYPPRFRVPMGPGARPFGFPPHPMHAFRAEDGKYFADRSFEDESQQNPKTDEVSNILL